MTRSQAIRHPTCLADVTAGWMTQALAARHPDVEVAAVEVGPFLGYKPNKARVRVEYAGTAALAHGLPESFIVKGGFKGDAPGGKASGLDIGLELELRAYEDLVPWLDAHTPTCFFVEFDPVGYDGTMLLEDLAPAGATFLKDATALTWAQALAFVRAQARLHAPWLHSPELLPGGRFGPGSPLAERTDRLHQGYLDELVRPAYWDTFIALPRGAAVPRRLHDAGRIAAAQQHLHAVHRDCALTIVHGDEHLGNLYLDADGNAGFIDWCARREPWVIGFTYFLLSTVDALDRREWERPLLEEYLAALERHGATPPTFEQAWFQYRCTTLFPFLTWLNNSARWQPEAVNTRNTVRAALAVVDHDALALLGV